MTAFFDTSMLIAATITSHKFHGRCSTAVLRVHEGQDEGYVCSHSLAEMYAGLTSFPIQPRFKPKEVEKIIRENVGGFFKIIYLKSSDYLQVIERMSAKSMLGGIIFDALILHAAEKVHYDWFYTHDVDDFQRLAPHLARKIRSP